MDLSWNRRVERVLEWTFGRFLESIFWTFLRIDVFNVSWNETFWTFPGMDVLDISWKFEWTFFYISWNGRFGRFFYFRLLDFSGICGRPFGR